MAALLAGLGSYPGYFRQLAEINRRGPRPLTASPALAALSVEQVVAAVDAGALLIDVRPVQAFAAAHLPGAVSLPLRPAFATWLGWTTDPATPLLFVRDADQDPEEIVWQALKIGYERLAGELDGGTAAWRAAGRSTRSTALLDAGALDGSAVLDVRQRAEFDGGHVPGATSVELGRLAEGVSPPPAPRTAVMCGHGERAMTAASLLERAGRRDVAVVVGGPDDWADATGRPLSRS